MFKHCVLMSTEEKTGALPNQSFPKVTRTIDDVTYEVTRFGWWELLDNLARAEQLLGPALTEGLKQDTLVRDLESLLASRADVLVRAATTLIQRFTDHNARVLMKTLGRQTIVHVEEREVRLTKDNLDTWFGQHPGHALQWLAFCLEVQFRDFFVIPGSLLMKLGQKMAKAANDEGQESSPRQEAA